MGCLITQQQGMGHFKISAPYYANGMVKVAENGLCFPASALWFKTLAHAYERLPRLTALSSLVGFLIVAQLSNEATRETVCFPGSTSKLGAQDGFDMTPWSKPRSANVVDEGLGVDQVVLHGLPRGVVPVIRSDVRFGGHQRLRQRRGAADPFARSQRQHARHHWRRE